MSRPDRVLLASLVVALAAWASGCGGAPSRSGTACTSDDECRPDARCSSHSCVLNAPPLADFAISGELRASSVVTLDGSGSRDPDGGDTITSYSWRIDPDGASCPAPEVASTSAVVQVRFGCAGQFRASLVVLDGKHLESAPATRPLQIEARTGPAMVEAGPDQSVDHVCTEATPICHLAAPVQLTAKATTQVNVSYHWTVQPPPGRNLDEHRRVRFLPDANAQNPTVEIETDGTAISGDWQFRIEVRDPVGVLDADVTRVSVANQPPVIHGGPAGAFDHQFDASTRLFTAADSFPVEVSDPDGDPVERQLAFHHAGDGAAAFLGQDLGTSIRFAVAVPFAVPRDALFLEGAEGLDRSIVLTATDVNGAATDATYPVEITNRPPVLVRGGELSALHSYDPASRRFLSQPSVGQWLDPDGDPLSYTASADPECPSFVVGGDGTVRMQCSRAFTGVGSLPGFLRERQALVGVQDPWAAAAATVTFRIANRAPLALQSTFRPSVACDLRSVTGPWCPGTGSGLERANHFPSTLVYPPPGVADPDGDPLDVRPGSGPSVSCSPNQSCVLTALTPDSISCDFSPPDMAVPFVATDGVASSPGSVLVDPVCW